MFARPPADSRFHNASSLVDALRSPSANAAGSSATRTSSPVDEIHAFDRRRGRDDRQSVAHRQVDLALHARAVAQRRDRHATSREVRVDVGDVSQYDEVVGGQRRDRRRQPAADDVRLDAGKRAARTCGRISRAYHMTRVDVGRVLEAADEHEARALGEGLTVADQLVDVRQQMTRDAGASSASNDCSNGETTSVTSALRDQRELLVALRPRRRASQRLPPSSCGLPLLAQEMQVHGVEYDQRLAARTRAPRRCASPRRNDATA